MVGVKQVNDQLWQVSFMDYDQRYFDMYSCRVEPGPNPFGPRVLSHLYTESKMREAFTDWEIVELSEYEAELREGDRHVGRSALIGMVARRR